MENVFQDLLKNKNSLLSRSRGNINILTEDGDNSFGIYGLYTYPTNFFIFDTSSSSYQEGYEIVRNKANFILFLKNINDDPNTILSISNTGKDDTWIPITGFKKVEEECPEFFLLISELEACKDYLYSTPIDFQDWETGYFKISYFSDHISQQFNITPEDDASMFFNLEIYDTSGNSVTASYTKGFSYEKEDLFSLSSIRIRGVSEKNINNVIKISKDKTDWEAIDGFGRTDTSLDLSEIIPSEAKNLYEFVGVIPKNFELSEYISNISFHDWDKAYIQCEYAKSEDNLEGITKELIIIPATNIQWESDELLSSDKLNFIEKKLQEVSNNNYIAKTWQDNETIDLNTVNNWENNAQQYSFNYVKQVWNENDEITASKLNHIKTFYSRVGEIRIKDGIESICIYSSLTPQSWGQHIFVDKNHDLCYYFLGNDYVNNTDYYTNKWGYEWGGYNLNISTTTYNNEDIGKGLSGTNYTISLNLKPSYSSETLWDKVTEFRSSHSSDWFIPSLNELLEVYKQRYLLSNLSLIEYPSYWCSSIKSGKDSSKISYKVAFDTGESHDYVKNCLYVRSRLCYYV